ncbi:helix-turn-helix domain-containing protein [Allobranchiibius sp. CTAmp26]|nr:helix-turn-helix domain-containing protein [Allobranchiibius sp. CTAmp26]
MDNADLGSALRSRRAAAGRTIASVAMDAGLSVTYIANLENGRGNPTVGALDALTSALGGRLQVTLSDDQEPTNPSAEDLIRVDQFLRHPRLTAEARRLAATTGRPLPQVREHFLHLLAALSRLATEPLTTLDVDRLVDLVILTTRRPRS